MGPTARLQLMPVSATSDAVKVDTKVRSLRVRSRETAYIEAVRAPEVDTESRSYRFFCRVSQAVFSRIRMSHETLPVRLTGDLGFQGAGQCALAVSSAFAAAVLWLDKIIDAWTRSCPSGRLPHGDGSRHVPPLSKVEPFSDSSDLVLKTGSIRSRGLSDPVCQPRGGSRRTCTKNSSIWPTALRYWSKSTGLVT